MCEPVVLTEALTYAAYVTTAYKLRKYTSYVHPW
jgi:hypothetical protein